MQIIFSNMMEKVEEVPFSIDRIKQELGGSFVRETIKPFGNEMVILKSCSTDGRPFNYVSRMILGIKAFGSVIILQRGEAV